MRSMPAVTRAHRPIVAAVAALLALSGLSAATATAAPVGAAAAPLGVASGAVGGAAGAGPVILGAGHRDAIAGSYLVIYRDGARADLSAGLDVRYRYTAPRGFAARMDEATAKRLAADPAVAFVEQDRLLRQAGTDTTQLNPPNWGLDRIDQTALPLNGQYTFTSTGTGVRAYLISTGIAVGHAEFGGRATWGTNTSGDGNNSDCHGLGTHLAGIVGGGSTGVAKQVRLVAVKIVPCGVPGTVAGAVAGVDWVSANHVKPAVALFGVATSIVSVALDNAVMASINAGVHYSVPAGNANVNACNYSPSRAPAALTVGATTRTDYRASFSNFGQCLDLFAPGVDIHSTWVSSGYRTMSGTEQAAAHATGVAAKYLWTNPNIPPGGVTTALLTAATVNVVVNPGAGSPNRLVRTYW
ncbi:MAG TPA: S8 family serine peptidase [Pseudonocardiaceae bacterium]